MAHTKGIRLTRSECERLLAFVEDRGGRAASAALKLSDQTLSRAAAGLAIHPSTAELIRMKLAEGVDE